MLSIGDIAPDFTAPTNGDGSFTLSKMAGKPVVLYFYPKDDTPGCTKQAIGFTEKKDDFAAAGAAIVGVSKDTAAKHDKFIAKHDLDLTLVADTDGSICENYGTWVEKNMYGRTSMGIERATYLIDAQGKIAQIWRKVKVPGHIEAVLDAVRTL